LLEDPRKRVRRAGPTAQLEGMGIARALVAEAGME
jgi:hypothetical protein